MMTSTFGANESFAPDEQVAFDAVKQRTAAVQNRASINSAISAINVVGLHEVRPLWLSSAFYLDMVPITFRHSFGAATVMGLPQISLLLEQKKVIKHIAKAGKDCIIVGRNADVILKKYAPFRVFVCVNMEAKIKRCIERIEDGASLSRRQIGQNIHRIDKDRAKTCELVSGEIWGNPVNYDMTVNTTEWKIKSLAPAFAKFSMRYFEGTNEDPVI